MAIGRQISTVGLTILWLAAGGGACTAASLPATADPAECGTAVDCAGGPKARSGGETDNNGSDYTRPQSSFDVRFNDRISSAATSRTDRDGLLLRLAKKIDLGMDWKLAVLAQLPIEAKATSTAAGTERESGFGNAAFQAALSHPIDARWAFGFGARLVSPTASDNLGGGKWVIMPGAGVRVSLPELGPDSYFVPVVRYAMSFAGDPSRRNISEPQIAPTLNVGLPDRWFVTFYPSNDIRINCGDPISGQTGRLFLPFDLALGRAVNDSLVISLEVSVPVIKDYPVYDFKSELRIVSKY
jgi:hypothetical protein